MNCPKCNSEDVVKKGCRRLMTGWRQTYICKECGRRFTPIVEKEEHEERVGPRILVIDIETLPMLVYAFQLKTDYISPENVVVPTILLAWSAQWLNESNIIGDVLTSDEAVRHDDKRLCIGIYNLINLADLVVAYNGDRFDFRKLNYRFIVNGLQPPSDYRTIDPIKCWRSQFGADSNKLDFLNGLLDIDEKLNTHFQLWKECFEGNQKALREMLKYNKNDVHVLREHYLRIRPWMKRHPNLGVYFDTEKEVCRICGGTELREVLDKYHHTNLGKYSLYRCQDCGAESTGRCNELCKEKRKGLVK